MTGIAPYDLTALRELVDTRDGLQRQRIAFGLRITAVEQGRDEAGEERAKLLAKWFERFSDEEKEIETDIRALARSVPIVVELTAIKGIGLMLGAKLIALIGPVDRLKTVSQLWRFAGYGQGQYWLDETGRPVVPLVGKKWVGEKKARKMVEVRNEQGPEGTRLAFHRDVPISEYVLPYSRRLKTHLWVVGGSLLRAGEKCPYRRVYDEGRERYERRVDGSGKPWTPLHQHQAAMRLVAKLLLAHTWERWRSLEGLPVRQPYALEQGGHTTYKRPEDYGWKPLGEASASAVDEWEEQFESGSGEDGDEEEE